MDFSEPVNILLVDDQPAKLLSYEAMLGSLGENLIRASSGNEASTICSRKTSPSSSWTSACRARRVRAGHDDPQPPRFQKTAIIHVSAVNLTDIDRLRGYDSGAVDYVSVPVVPEVLRAKVKVFADLYRKSEELKRLNADLELRVAERHRAARGHRRPPAAERGALPADGRHRSVLPLDGRRERRRHLRQRALVRVQRLTIGATTLGSPRPTIPTTDERCREEWARAVTDVAEYRTEARLRGRDGDYRWFLIHAVAQQAGERARGWFGVTTDIHEQKALAVKLREGDRRKDEFLAMLAHELRNPLAAIRSALDVVRHPGRSTAQGRWGQGVIDRQTSHLTRMIDDLLDVGSHQPGQAGAAQGVRGSRGGDQAAVESGRPAIDQRGIELTLSLPPEPIYLSADRVRLCQVFLNLLDNATKYTPRGGTHRAAGRALRATAPSVRVTDTGIGIAARCRCRGCSSCSSR
jgi:signal transduction histidine kinase